MFLLSGIDLENIVYYKDSTHYFVMTAKKQSLLDKGVILNVCTCLGFLPCLSLGSMDWQHLQMWEKMTILPGPT